MRKNSTTEEVKIKSKRVYCFVKDFIEENGFPPTVREICKKCNILSTGTAYTYLKKLEQSGLLEKQPTKNRCITLTENKVKYIKAPIINKIKVENTSIFDNANLEGKCPLPTDFNNERECFSLRATDDKMKNSGINKNDIVIAKKCIYYSNGDLSVVLHNNVAYVRKIYNINCQLIAKVDCLDDNKQDNNEQFIVTNENNLLGKVIGIIRKF